MNNHIPLIVEQLYHYFAWEISPNLWPDHLRKDPIHAHGLWAFYRGMQLGVQLADACLDKN